ncbi:MAG: GntR family transcriptional regulator [Hamadaea sp.]|uniref:GntR family transcriptional regulator n=1 Tax=Hamadaea sp. TaxID=2024425 RepID=UPI0018525F2D|nr:GntR family transcriptional regulator [Hamadaea sp.]NUT20277.1 GntR family transcriptional regulator [Hamadaea sp.]
MATVELRPGPVPPYEQIRAQIAELIAIGTLPAGHRLPSIRQLAADLGVATGTVARAYQEMEIAGLVRTRGSGGTVVASRRTGEQLDPAGRLSALALSFVTAARRLGADDAAILESVRGSL